MKTLGYHLIFVVYAQDIQLYIWPYILMTSNVDQNSHFLRLLKEDKIYNKYILTLPY